MNYLPRTAIKRLAATHGYSGPHLTDHDLTEIRLAAVAAIKMAATAANRLSVRSLAFTHVRRQHI